MLYSSNEPGELSQWLCHDDSTINIVLVIIILLSDSICITHSLISRPCSVTLGDKIQLFIVWILQQFWPRPSSSVSYTPLLDVICLLFVFYISPKFTGIVCLPTHYHVPCAQTNAALTMQLQLLVLCQYLIYLVLWLIRVGFSSWYSKYFSQSSHFKRLHSLHVRFRNWPIISSI